MFDVTSEIFEDTSVFILKSRLTLQVILPARASLVKRQRTSVILHKVMNGRSYTYVSLV